MIYKLSNLVWLGLFCFTSAHAKDWSAGTGYGELPTSGCPSQTQFGHKHFKQLKALAGCATPKAMQASPRIYRGGAPSEEGAKCLTQSFHVQAVFDLRTESEQASEKKAVEHAGMLYYPYPLSTGSSAATKKCKSAGLSAAACNRQNVLDALDTIERLLKIDPLAKIYVHCARGEDRTGLLIGLYRVLKEGCPASRALAEMKEYYYYPYEPLKKVWDELTASSKP